MRWLVSYRYRTVFKYTSNRLSEGSWFDAIVVFDKHPVVVMADAKKELVELYDRPVTDIQGYKRVDEIGVIYSVIEIPNELWESLSDEQREALEYS